MLKEFREFIQRGNVMDLAVGVIIGGAFGAIVNSLVNDVIMPIIGLATKGVNFQQFYIQLSPAKDGGTYPTYEEFTKAGGSGIGLGSFIGNIITFLIVAFCVFLIVKAINKLNRKPQPEPAAPAPPAEDIVLLTEIRDLLKKS